MLLAYEQLLNPLKDRLRDLDLSTGTTAILSTVFAAVPVVVLFWLLVPRRWLAPKAAGMGALSAVIVAWLVYGMPLPMASMAFLNGALFGLVPLGWTVFTAMLLYNITVVTGEFTIIRRSVAGLSGDARIQAILVAFAFGAFLEGAAGGGTPVAICGAMMVGLGFNPFLAAVLCLIANTSPVAYGGLGNPILTLSSVTGIPGDTLSVMAAHQLPFLSCIVPIWMVKCMCSWKQTREVLPALIVAGGSFAFFQYTFATIHTYSFVRDYMPSLVLWPMTDIGAGLFSLIISAIFLRFWKPKNEWHFDQEPVHVPAEKAKPHAEPDGHAAAAAALLGPAPTEGTEKAERPLTPGIIARAWLPYLLMSCLLMTTGFIRQEEGRRKGKAIELLGPIQTSYLIEMPLLNKEILRDKEVQEEDKRDIPEEAVFTFNWLTTPGTAVLAAALFSMVFFRMSREQIMLVFKRTVYQMRIPIPTIACMIGLSYVTRFAGMDATLGYAFASTGVLYPFFAAILGWLGVFLTGTDAGSNALFGSLQKITATVLHKKETFSLLTQPEAQVLICTANSTGGVMGKMIDAQSICVATAATNQIGKEADIFKAVIWHSIILAAIVGLITLVQAYVFPFTNMVP